MLGKRTWRRKCNFITMQCSPSSPAGPGTSLRESCVPDMSWHCSCLHSPFSLLCYCLSFAKDKSMCRVNLLLDMCGDAGEEDTEKMRVSCSQLQVPGHLNLSGAVRRVLKADFGNLSPNRRYPTLGSILLLVLHTASLSIAFILSLFLLTFHICSLFSHKTLQTFLVFNLYPGTYQHSFFLSPTASAVPELPGRCCIPSATTQPYHCALCLTQWTWVMEASPKLGYKPVLCVF